MNLSFFPTIATLILIAASLAINIWLLVIKLQKQHEEELKKK